MTDLNQLRRLAGVPIDLSKINNARETIITPSRLPFASLSEAATVPKHRGEISPKTKKNMRQRVSCAKKALEALEMARDELMSLPAIDYMEHIPDLIRQLHKLLHGEDGTGGLHAHARQYEREYNDMDFPEDLENTDPGEDGNPTEDELEAKEKEKAKKAKEKEKAGNEKKSVKEGMQAVDRMLQGKNALANSVQSTAGEMEGEGNNTADNNSEQEEDEQALIPNRKIRSKRPGNNVLSPEYPQHSNRWNTRAEDIQDDENDIDPALRKLAKDNAGEMRRRVITANGNPFDEQEEDSDEEDCETSVSESKKSKKPKWLEKSEVKAEKKAGKKVSDSDAMRPEYNFSGGVRGKYLPRLAKKSKKEEKKVGVKESSRVIFDTGKNKNWIKPGSDLEKKFANDAKNNNAVDKWESGDDPINIVKSKQGNLFYPKTTHDEGPNQIQTNPYNESQKVHVPTTIKSQLKAQADEAQRNADMFMSRKDLDSKNFYEDMAKAFYDLHTKLDEGTLYSIKEAQILMTSMTNIFTSKIPPDVVKFIAAGGTVRPLKDYMKTVTGNFDEWHIHPSK